MDLILKPRTNKKKKKKIIPHVTTFNEKNPPYKKWFRELQYILKLNPKTEKISEKVMFVTRQNKNLQRQLTSSKVKDPNFVREPLFEEGASSGKCTGCHACPKVKETKRFRSINTKRTYQIRKKLNCNSKFVIYLVQCLNCLGQYVGKSETPFKVRHSNHKREIKTNIGGLGEHFHNSECKFERNYQVTLIDSVKSGDKVALKKLENLQKPWWLPCK